MRRWIASRMVVVVLLFLPTSLLTRVPQNKSVADPNASVTIQDVVSQGKDALSNVQTKLANKQLPPLKSVKLTLQTVATNKAGATISFWVITIGGSLQKDATQQLVIELVPPKAGNASNVSSENFTQALEDSIINAAVGVQNAAQGPVPLQLNSLAVTLGFTVTAEGTAGAKLTLAPITLDVSGTKNKKALHTLEVTYGTSVSTPDKK
jgi:hypothetical protein